MSMRQIEYRPCSENPIYEISSDGRVFSHNYKNSGRRKELRQRLDRYGYPIVFMSSNGRKYKRTVHRLVAFAFLGNPIAERTHVNHKNGVRHDNDFTNLEWVTHQENVQHSWKVNGRKHSESRVKAHIALFTGESNPVAKLTTEQVLEIKDKRRNGATLKELSAEYGVATGQISSIARGKSWSHLLEQGEKTE